MKIIKFHILLQLFNEKFLISSAILNHISSILELIPLLLEAESKKLVQNNQQEIQHKVTKWWSWLGIFYILFNISAAFLLIALDVGTPKKKIHRLYSIHDRIKLNLKISKFSLLNMFLFQLTRKIHDQLDFSSPSAQTLPISASHPDRPAD